MSKVQAHSYDLGPRFSELVLHELDPRYSREEVTLAASSGELPFGMVLARNADGTYAPLKEADGTLGDAGAVLIQHAAPSESSQVVMVLRGYCIINRTKLQWDTSVSKKDEAVLALRDLGFAIRAIEEVEDEA